jgi:hypothetical protein
VQAATSCGLCVDDDLPGSLERTILRIGAHSEGSGRRGFAALAQCESHFNGVHVIRADLGGDMKVFPDWHSDVYRTGYS